MPALSPLLSPEDALLDQAFFWASGQPPQAIASLERLLRLEPDNAAALALLAQVSVDANLPEVANVLLRRLRAAHPDDPGISVVEQVIRNGPVDQAALSEARDHASNSQPNDAIEAYKRAFHGDTPPDFYASEYFMVLQGLEGRLADAQAGLAAVMKRYPHNVFLAFDDARVMSYDESTRGDGIDMLHDLFTSRLPSMEVRHSWRDALLWQGPDYRAQAQLEAYLALFPGDPQLEAQREEFRRSLPDDGARARWAGYQAMEDKQYAEAERQFSAALVFNPRDADSLMAMAALRVQQGRAAEGRRLSDEAMAIAPERRDEFLAAMHDTSTGADAGEAIRRSYARVRQLTDAGDYAAAQAALRRLRGSRPSASYYVQLGSIQARAGETADAETSLQQALAMQPGDPAALTALAHLHSTQLRDQAAAAKDTGEKERLLQAAVAADPANPWARLELASLLADQHHVAAATQIMANVATGPNPGSDEIQAGLNWADRRHDLTRAGELLALLPPQQRTVSTQTLALRVSTADDIRQAAAASDSAIRRSNLLGLAAARPDPTGLRGAAVANAFIRLGDRPDASEAVAVALRATPDPTPSQRLQYIDPLIRAGDSTEARRLAASIDPQSLQPDERLALRGVTDGLAINQSDTLSLAGKPAQAFAVLAPHLAADPKNTQLNLAVSRVYQAAQRPRDALRIAQDTLHRDPADLDAQRGAVDAAISAGNLALASQIAASAVQTFPDDPRAQLMLASVATARDRNQVALDALRKARALRQQQLNEAQAQDVLSTP